MKTKKNDKKEGSKISYRRIIAMGVILLSLATAGFFLNQKRLQFYHKSSEAAPNSTVSFSPASVTLGANQAFSLQAKINPGTNEIVAVELHASFDPTKFNVTGVSVDNAVWNTLQAAQMDNTNGKASVIVAAPPQTPTVGIKTSTTVATFSFKSLASSVSPASPNITFDSTTQASALNEPGNPNVITGTTGASVTVDATPPSLSGGTVATPNKSVTPTCSFTSTEAGTYTFGGDCANTPSGSAVNGSNTITLSTLSAGTHSNCTVKVTDAAGNQSASLPINNFTIDTAPPTLNPITLVPTLTNNRTPSYTFSSSEVGNIAYAGDCKSSTTTATASNNTIVLKSATLGNLADGLHNNCTITVTDGAGNVSIPLSINSFTIDTAPPTLNPITLVPTFTNNPTPSYTFSSSEVGNIAYAGDCKSSTTTATASNNTIVLKSATLGNLADGLHNNCTITVTDGAGNVSIPLSINSFTIDTTPPTLNPITLAPTFTNNPTPSYTFSSSEAGNIAYAGDCKSSTTTATASNNTIVLKSATLGNLADGLHNNCTITVTDGAGNVSISLSINNFTIDTTPPTLSNGYPSGSLVSTTTQATLSLSTNENATCKYSTTANTAYGSMANTFSTTGTTSHSSTVSGLAKGTAYNYYVRCIDQAGNANSADYPITFAVAMTIPGDLDQNGVVDIFDYSNIFLPNFGRTNCGNPADIDGNCKVDIFDYSLFVQNFGKHA